uniref:Uncharacterized protein n=1 Tax=Leersia perrieri TaxID=77586 RepID=A0A0D9XXA0_9ORYZ
MGLFWAEELRPIKEKRRFGWWGQEKHRPHSNHTKPNSCPFPRRRFVPPPPHSSPPLPILRPPRRAAITAAASLKYT